MTVLDEKRQLLWEQTARAAPNPSRAFVLSDPVELKLTKVVADIPQSDFDESSRHRGRQRRGANLRKKGGAQSRAGVTTGRPM